jgi:hypothetical protein
MQITKIQFQYFEGCPNSKNTVENLLKVIDELKIDRNKFEIINVNDFNLAKNLNFQGSPTILIDGIDIYTDKKPEGFNYSCRVYNINNISTGIIPEEFIRVKLKSFLERKF